MQSNGTHNSIGHNGNGNGAVTADNLVTFPKNEDTQLKDISDLLHGAPVIQQAPVASTSDKPANAIATANDFARAEDTRPFARQIGPKVLLGALLSLVILTPLAGIFLGGGNPKINEKVARTDGQEVEVEGKTYVSAEDYAQLQSELEQRRTQQAFADQQVDAAAIEAAGRQQKQNEAAARASQSPKPKTETNTPATTTQPRSVRVSSRPTAARAAPRTAPVATAPRTTESARRTEPAREPEPVNPFERRAKLQALGTYGAPPPMAQTVAARAPRFSNTANPFETENYYIEAIALEQPQARPDILQTTEQPETEKDLTYQQDAEAVLTTETPAPPEADVIEVPTDTETPVQRDDTAVLDPRRTSSAAVDIQGAETATQQTQMAIMPGTSVEAELPYGFNWQEGTTLPEVLLQTTEALMAGDQTVIPEGTQFLGQAQIDPSSGAVNIQIVGILGETRDIQIPRSSVVVRAGDGDVLTANTTGGPSTPGPNVSGFLMEALRNGLSNVIDSDDGLATDIAGGVAETYIDNQIDRTEASESARASRSSERPVIWSLGARPVQLTFNNLIPLSNAQR